MLCRFQFIDSPALGHEPNRGGATFLLLLGALAAIAALVVGAGYFMVGGPGEAAEQMLLHSVQRGTFVHDVVERGEVESSSNVEIRCEVKSNNTSGTAILDVLEEGTRVQPGDVLVRLDSSSLEQQLVEQKILFSTSEAAAITARNAYEAAKIAKKEYEEGTFRQEEQIIENELFVAEENLRRAHQYARYSERLAAKGYVTALQLEGDLFAVEKARNEVDTARTKLRVLREYTREKTLMTLESAIGTAEAQLKAAQESYQLESNKLKDIQEQIAKCVIRAPQAGTVVYANRESRRSESEFVVEPGALVLERQVIIRLPDPGLMQVKAEINESRVTLVKSGMQVTIGLDAFPDQTLRGEVVKVNEYPEAGGWFSSQVKEYATFVKIFEPPPLIRPGLTAEVRIHVAREEDALQVPVQAIHEHGDKLFCMLQRGDRWQANEVQIGASNDKFVRITSGLEENDLVAMNPRALLDKVSLPKLVQKPHQEIAAGKPAGTPLQQASEIRERLEGPSPGGESDQAVPPTASAISGPVADRWDRDATNQVGGDELAADHASSAARASANGHGRTDGSEPTSSTNGTTSDGTAQQGAGAVSSGALP